MSVNEALLNKEIAHAIDVLGYSNGVSRKMVKLLNQADEDLFAKLTLELEKVTPSPEKLSRINALLKSVNNINHNAYGNLADSLESELQGFTEAELVYQEGLLNSVQPVKLLPISHEAVYAAAMAAPFQGRFLSEFLAGMSLQKATLIRDAVRIGFIESQTTGEIVRKIRGTKALNYTDGLINITRHNAESVVITAIAHTANVAQTALYEANEGVLKGYRYTATLDTRTTELCASRDGNFYKIGKPRPALPAHIRCRSRYVAVVKSFKELGLDVELPEGTRASMDGQVPAKTTYQQWLKKQSVARQNEVLGVAKAKIFREGNLPLDKFVSPTGHVYTLDQLKVRNVKQYYIGESLVSNDLLQLPVASRNTLRAMYEVAAKNKDGFDADVAKLAESVGAVAQTARLKGTARTVEKIIDDYDGDPTKVKDLLRATIEVKSLSEVENVIAKTQAKYGTLVKLRNWLQEGSPSSYGYRDVNMVVNNQGGMAEIQINLSQILEVKHIAHKDYKVARKLKAARKNRPLYVEELVALKNAENNMELVYNKVWEQVLKGQR